MNNIAILNWLEHQSLIIQAVVVLAFVIFLNLSVRFTLEYLNKKYKEGSRAWLVAVIGAIKTPIRYINILIGLTILSFLATDQMDSNLVYYIYKGIVIALITCVAWFFIRLIRRTERMISVDLRKQSHGDRGLRDEGTLKAMAKVLEGMVFVIAVLVILSFLNVSVSGLVTFGGLSAAAIALSAKDMLGNILGGTMLYLDRPFLIGDNIASSDKDIEGTVESIGWRLTVVRRKDKTCLYIPNGTFNSLGIINVSRMSHRLINTTFGMRYEDAHLVQAVIADLLNYLRAHPQVDTSCPLLVNIDSFKESSINLLIYALIKVTAWPEFRKVQDEIMLQALTIMQRHGAQSAFPSITTLLKNSQ